MFTGKSTRVSYVCVLFMLLVPLFHASNGADDEGGQAFLEVKEAVVGVDSLDAALSSLPLEGGLLKLTYNSSQGPTVMNTLSVENKRVTIQGLGSQAPGLTCNGEPPENTACPRIPRCHIEDLPCTFDRYISGLTPAVYIGGHVDVLDLVIQGCTGTAIEIASPKTTSAGWRVQVQRCRFVRNFHAIKKEDAEGGSTVGGHVNITKSDFISGTGSAVDVQGVKSLAVWGSRFVNNTSGSSGGGVFLRQNKNQEPWSINISQSIFEGNKAKLGFGGGIAVESKVNGSVVLRHSNFTGNIAKWGGGFSTRALEGDVNSSEAELEFPNLIVHVYNGHFLGNLALESGGGVDLRNVTLSTVEESVFENCTAKHSGGGMEFLSNNTKRSWEFTVLHSFFHSNKAELKAGGGVFVKGTDDGRVFMEYAYFSKNTGYIGGGFCAAALAAATGDLDVEHEVSSLTVQISECQFLANSGFKSGGGVSLVDITSATVESSIFEHCSSNSSGAGFDFITYNATRSWTLRVLESEFYANEAEGRGGGITVRAYNDGVFTLDKSNFIHNVAASGGGLTAEVFPPSTNASEYSQVFPNVSLHISQCKFLQNSALKSGGGARLWGITSSTVEGTIFKQCSARISGGGIEFVQDFAHSPWIFSVMESVFDGTKAELGQGGGVLARSKTRGSLTVSGTNFTHTTAHFGGGISAIATVAPSDAPEAGSDLPNVTVHIYKCSFISISTDNAGGVSLRSIASSIVEESVFEQCSSRSGGGISFSFGSAKAAWTFYVLRSRFDGNNAKRYGGAIDLDSSMNGTILVEGTNFTKNIAKYGGGMSLLALLDYLYPTEAAHDFPNVTAHIYRSRFFRNVALSGSGGGLDLSDIASTTVQESVFERCSAQTTGGGIGFIYLYQDRPWTVNVIESVFDGNTAEMDAGGGLSLESSVQGITIVRGTNFTYNMAKLGGGLAAAAYFPDAGLPDSSIPLNLSDFNLNTTNMGGEFPTGSFSSTSDDSEYTFDSPNVTVHISECNFFGNSQLNGLLLDKSGESGGGGAISLMNITLASVESSQIRGGSARYGAALLWVCSFNYGVLSLTNSNISNNLAKLGGTVFMDRIGQLRITGCNFERNKCLFLGGGLYFTHTGSRPNSIVLSDSSFVGNIAAVGGAIYGVDVSDVVIERVVFKENTGIVGGAIALDPGSTVFTSFSVSACQFVGNVAEDFDSSGPFELSSYGAFNGGGGAIAITSFFRSRMLAFASNGILIRSSHFKNNRATHGGALLATSPQDSHRKWLAILHCTFEGNIATKSGGAFVVDKPDQIGIVCTEGGLSSTLQQISPAYCATWNGNAVEQGSGMENAPNVVAALSLGGIKLNPSYVGRKQSRPTLPPISIYIQDVLNMSRVFGGIGKVDVTAECHDKDVMLVGETRLSAINGTVVFTDLRAWGPPGDYTITFNATNAIGLSTTNTAQAYLKFELVDCEVGERRIVENRRFLRCEPCSEKFFSLDPAIGICKECVKHAECDSTEETHVHPLVPQDGYWHSSPFSTQIHKCIREASCRYDGRKEALQRFKASTLPRHLTSYSQTEYPLCREGSDGPLCGSCQEGYGHVKNGQCTKCSSNWNSVLGIVGGGLWSAVLMLISIYGNFPSPKVASEEIEIDGVPMIEIRNHESDESHMENNEDPSAPSKDYALEEDRLSDKRSLQIFKIGVNFFQVNSAAILMSYGWMDVLSGFMEFQDVSTLASASSYGNWLVPECAFYAYKDSAIRVAYLDAALPIALVLGIVGVWTSISVLCKRGTTLRIEIEIILWTSALYAYNGLTKSFMRIFNCIAIDEDDPDNPLNDYSIAKGLYWVSDTQYHCFRGGQRISSLLIGSAGAAFLLAGLPVYLCLFLYKMRNQLENPEFNKKYGFLYHTYLPEYANWESVIMFRKFFVTTIGVFSASLGYQLQGNLMLGVMVAAAMAHLILKPFKDRKLNSMEAWSLLTTCSTFYLGVVMKDTSQVWKYILSVTVFALNLVFCGALFVHLRQAFVTEQTLVRVLQSPFACCLASKFRKIRAGVVGTHRHLKEWAHCKFSNRV